jgi:hypothetical protein
LNQKSNINNLSSLQSEYMQKNLDVPKDNNFNQQNQKVYQQTSPKN